MTTPLSLRPAGVRLTTEIEGWPKGTVGTLTEPLLVTALFIVENPGRAPGPVIVVRSDDVENIEEGQ